MANHELPDDGGSFSRAVNFIADPWEWPEPVAHLDAQWLSNYRTFRARLHWLLLWYDEVWLQDSFAIYNRQFEHWFSNKRKASLSKQQALANLFEGRAIRIPLRQRGGYYYQSISDVYERDMRANPEYLWYHDGWPPAQFFADLDLYHGRSLLHYDGAAFPNRLEVAFNSAVDRTAELGELFDDFAELRAALSPGMLRQLRERIGHGTNWRRSVIYRLLGIGVDNDGQRVAPSLDLSQPAKSALRILVDGCAHHAIDLTLDRPTRFPSTTPITSLYGLHRMPSVPDPFKDIHALLSSEDIAAIALEGDVTHLFQQFAELDFQSICRLRNSTCFAEYRELYRKFEERKHSRDRMLLTAVAKQALACLREVGTLCAISITEGRGPAVLRWLSEPAGSNYVAWGLGIVLGGAVALAAPKVTGNPFSAVAGAGAAAAVARISQPSIVWLTTHMQPVGRPERPLNLRVSYMGGIKRDDVFPGVKA
jgi:hypothetical protein